jgi:hypothetical protein
MLEEMNQHEKLDDKWADPNRRKIDDPNIRQLDLNSKTITDSPNSKRKME